MPRESEPIIYMPNNRFPPIQSLRMQMLDWNDLSLDFQLAALPHWKEQGDLANRIFCLGA